MAWRRFVWFGFWFLTLKLLSCLGVSVMYSYDLFPHFLDDFNGFEGKVMSQRVNIVVSTGRDSQIFFRINKVKNFF